MHCNCCILHTTVKFHPDRLSRSSQHIWFWKIKYKFFKNGKRANFLGAMSALEELSIFLLQMDQKFYASVISHYILVASTKFIQRISSRIAIRYSMKCWDHAYKRVIFLLLPQSLGYTTIARKQIEETVAWLQQKRIRLIKRSNIIDDRKTFIFEKIRQI